MVTPSHLNYAGRLVNQLRTGGWNLYVEDGGAVCVVSPSTQMEPAIDLAVRRFYEGVRVLLLSEAIQRGKRFCWECGDGLHIPVETAPNPNIPLRCLECAAEKLTFKRCRRIMSEITGWSMN